MAKVFKILPQKVPRDYFKAYYSCSINKEEAENTGVVINDGLFEIKFIKEQNIGIVAGGHYLKLPPITMFGRVNVPSKIIIPKQLNYFTIKIQPWAASSFYDNQEVFISEISKNIFPGINQIHQSVFATDCFFKQVECVESFFLDKLPLLKDYELSKQICNLIYERNGAINVSEIRAMFPYSRQKINRIFFQQVKYSIKEFAILIRLRAIMSRYMKAPGKSLTELSYEFGYFDQSHFIKDMKRITGVSPMEFSKTQNVFYQQLKKAP